MSARGLLTLALALALALALTLSLSLSLTLTLTLTLTRGWADGAALEPYAHYRPVRAAIAGGHLGQTYALDTRDLFTQLAWCHDHPRANPSLEP